MQYFATLYAEGCATPSDIHEHLPTLYELAKKCEHITEMGVRTGLSTRAFLYAAPQRLVSYDLILDAAVEAWFEAAKSLKLNYSYIKGDTLELQIEQTDLLLIDTLHNYDQLKAELALHADAVGRYIVFHDTEYWGEIGESYSGQEGLKGIRYAIDEFLELHPEWQIILDVENCNGLVVIERVT
jgi:predicted O-methyltransferase YrrM